MLFTIYNAIYLSGLVVSVGLTIVSMVTPAWKKYQSEKYNSTVIKDWWWEDGAQFTYGLISGTCSGTGGWDTCKNYFDVSNISSAILNSS